MLPWYHVSPHLFAFVCGRSFLCALRVYKVIKVYFENALSGTVIQKQNIFLGESIILYGFSVGVEKKKEKKIARSFHIILICYNVLYEHPKHNLLSKVTGGWNLWTCACVVEMEHIIMSEMSVGIVSLLLAWTWHIKYTLTRLNIWNINELNLIDWNGFLF